MRLTLNDASQCQGLPITMQSSPSSLFSTLVQRRKSGFFGPLGNEDEDDTAGVETIANPDGEEQRLVTPEQISTLPPRLISALSPTQISSLSPAQVAAFTTDQIAALSRQQLEALTRNQIEGLTMRQIWAISKKADRLRTFVRFDRG